MGSFKRNKLVITGLSLLLLTVGGLGAWAMTTNKGTIVAVPENNRKQAALRTLNTTNIYFQYADNYKLEKILAGGNDLEMYNLSADTNYEKHLAVAVSNLNSYGLDNNSGFAARKTRTDVYDEQEIVVANAPAFEFSKKDHTEKTVFIPHGAEVAVFSFVTGSNYDDLDSEIMALLSSFKWKQ